MIIALDVGNTNITCAIFDEDNLVKKFSMPSDDNLTVLDYGEILKSEVGNIELDGGIIGSVVDELNSRIQYAILAQFGVMSVILSHKSNLPIEIKLKNNEEIGADRIANGVRGFELFKDSVIVVDFGTATTFDIVNSKGEFIGGIIAPGIKTQLKSLTSSTSKLKEPEIRRVEKVIGNSTEDAILSGVIRGTAGMVDEMIKKGLPNLFYSAFNVISLRKENEIMQKKA